MATRRRVRDHERSTATRETATSGAMVLQKYIVASRALGLGILACAIAACSGKNDVDRTDVLDFETEVSAADLRAARLLSLGNNPSLDAISDQSELAAYCVVSVEALAEKLREVDVLNPELATGIDSAVQIYRQRAIDSGMSPAELDVAIESRRAEEVDVSQQNRVAASCLRELA